MQTIYFYLGDWAVRGQDLLLLAGALVVFLLLWMALSLARLKRDALVEMSSMSEQSRDVEDQLRALSQLQADLGGRLAAVADVFGSGQSELARVLNERLDSVQHRVGQGLENTSRTTQETLAKLGERLAVIDGAQQRLQTLADEMVSLKDVLANKQARGAFGQTQMEAILRDGLPPDSYSFQSALSNGKRPDALVMMPNDPRPMAIDAKFPLEGFLELRASNDPATRRSAEQRVRVDMNKHLQDIASRYLIAGETQDIALMFVPSESIYADLHEHFPDMIQQSFRKRVMVVSPSLMMLAVQMMRGQIRDAKMREQIHVLQSEMGHLVVDVVRLRERADKLELHFRQAQEDVAQVKTSADKIHKRSSRMQDMEISPQEIAEIRSEEPRIAAE